MCFLCEKNICNYTAAAIAAAAVSILRLRFMRREEALFPRSIRITITIYFTQVPLGSLGADCRRP